MGWNVLATLYFMLIVTFWLAKIISLPSILWQLWRSVWLQCSGNLLFCYNCDDPIDWNVQATLCFVIIVTFWLAQAFRQPSILKKLWRCHWLRFSGNCDVLIGWNVQTTLHFVITVTSWLIIIIMEICKVPTLRLKALNKHKCYPQK